MNAPLTLADLPSVEDYARTRDTFRTRVLAAKKSRQVRIGENVTLLFENRDTVLYQVLEMLRIEKTADPAAMQDELDAYNPLIPDGKNWKATFMLEFEDVDVRRQRLAELIGVEAHVWMQVAGCERITPIYNEDMERSDGEKTAAVHFMRFELNEAMIKALKGGATLGAGIDHDAYRQTIDPVPANIVNSLLMDLD